MKLQSVAQQRQLQYMRPYLCQWAGDCEENPMKASNVGDRPANEGIHIPPKGEAGRRRAAPHIKTYIRFHDKTTMNCIDWAMITSANLSTQAWGAAPNATGEVRICSWEIGVLLWPELIVSDSPEEGQHGKVKMVPCFKKDSPDLLHSENDTQIVGFRMPYDLPLTPYDAHDLPWCATMEHPEPDWLGHVWRP